MKTVILAGLASGALGMALFLSVGLYGVEATVVGTLALPALLVAAGSVRRDEAREGREVALIKATPEVIPWV
mgnify:CR=1 FL=1